MAPKIDGITVTVHEPTALFFKEAWATGTHDGRTFHMDRTVGGHRLVLDLEATEHQPRRVESIRIADLVQVWLERNTTDDTDPNRLDQEGTTE